MVKRFEPCHKYFDEYDEDGSPSCQEAKDGEYVLYETYKNEQVRLTAQIERLKQQVANLTSALDDSHQEIFNLTVVLTQEEQEDFPQCFE